MPTVPLLALVGVLVALLPAVLAPLPPDRVKPAPAAAPTERPSEVAA
jgi:hypothetical protein